VRRLADTWPRRNDLRHEIRDGVVLQQRAGPGRQRVERASVPAGQGSPAVDSCATARGSVAATQETSLNTGPGLRGRLSTAVNSVLPSSTFAHLGPDRAAGRRIGKPGWKEDGPATSQAECVMCPPASSSVLFRGGGHPAARRADRQRLTFAHVWYANDYRLQVCTVSVFVGVLSSAHLHMFTL